MRASALFLAPLLLAGCAAQETQVQTADTATVGGAVRCIDATRVSGRRAEDNRTLVFELAGGTIYRNTLREACPGIARASGFGTLAVDPVESRLCRGDMVRVYDPADVRDPKTAPRCRLGAFTRIR